MIAISYRREDTLPVTGRLYDRLQMKFGGKNVFMDFDAISPGVDFREQIKEAIGGSDVVIAVIGPNWLGERADGSRRIDDEADFVRLEIAYALERGIALIPILVNDTEMPAPEKLPADIAGLAFRNAVNLDTGIDFHHHADRLIKGICELTNRHQLARSGMVSQPPPRFRHKNIVIALTAIATLGSAVVWLILRNASPSVGPFPDYTASAVTPSFMASPHRTPLPSIAPPSPTSSAKPEPTRVVALASPPVRKSPPVRTSILVDLKAGTVDGISLKPEGPALQAALGTARVRKTTEMLGEGADNADVFIVSFGSHHIRRYWYLFTFSDPAFRTVDDLGVGSTVGDFERVYGPGKKTPEWESGGYPLHFGLGDSSSHFAIILSGAAANASESSLKQFPVKEIFVWCN